MSRSKQRGDALILTLVVLVTITLGFLYVMRTVFTDTIVAGNNLQRQKNAQATDMALRFFQENTLRATYANFQLDLALNATAQPWYRVVAPGTVAPGPEYWASCLGNSDVTLRCGAITLPNGLGGVTNATALATVQPTGKSDNCGGKVGLRGVYYDVFVYVRENAAASGTSATSESVFRLCVP